jgi:hypothetical protein
MIYLEGIEMKKILAVVIMLALSISVLSGCGDNKANASEDTAVPAAQIETLTGKYVLASDESTYYEFFDDGTCEVGTFGFTSDCSYALQGNEVKVAMEYGSFTGTVDADKITFIEFGEEVEYLKQ